MTNDLINRWIRPEVRALAAYHVPDSHGFIKLDAMENPYSLPEALIESWLETLRQLELNRYPDASAGLLKERLQQYLGLGVDQEILLGNGSDELIQILAMAVAGENRTILAPEPSFVMYRIIAQSLGMQYVGVPLNDQDFSLDMPEMLAAIEKHQPAVIFLAYPNNPTGNLFDQKDIEAILEASNGLVIIDEAYHSFAQVSWIDDMHHYENLLVMRTLSKIGLAGLRIGMLVGPKQWLDQLNKIRLPYNINALSQASATFMLKHVDVFDQQAAQIRADRQFMFDSLSQHSKIEVWSSYANFLLLRSEKSQEIFDSLKQNNILIKNLDGAHKKLAQCLRVTIGTMEENNAFLKVIELQN
ncbi:MAG: histidinol-phosphate transaminase [Gammaproteobacteria bacterium]